jgi:hypothetical protein
VVSKRSSVDGSAAEAQQDARAGDFDGDRAVGSGVRGAVRVRQREGDVREVTPVRRDARAVGCGVQPYRAGRGAQGVAAGLGAVAVGDGEEFAGLVQRVELGAETVVVAHRSAPQRVSVDEEFDLVGVAVDLDRDRFALVSGPRPAGEGVAPRPGCSGPGLAGLRGRLIRRATRAAGLPDCPTLVLPGNLDTAEERLRAFLAEHPDVTAVLAYNDDLALVTLAAMRRLGLRAPDDLAVIGFDDTPHGALFSPALTTVHIDAEAIGRSAARTALGLPTADTASEPARVIVRESA